MLVRDEEFDGAGAGRAVKKMRLEPGTTEEEQLKEHEALSHKRDLHTRSLIAELARLKGKVQALENAKEALRLDVEARENDARVKHEREVAKLNGELNKKRENVQRNCSEVSRSIVFSFSSRDYPLLFPFLPSFLPSVICSNSHLPSSWKRSIVMKC